MIEVTCAFIIEKDKVLITQNDKNSDHPLQWEFPGGKIKSGETAEACIIREIKEELELDISVEETMVEVEHDYSIKKIRLIPFICKIKRGTLKLNNHIAEQWVKPELLTKKNLSKADERLISQPQNKYILEEYTRKQVDQAR